MNIHNIVRFDGVKAMFLSMIIPVYNAGKYLAECLDSCTQQDISPDDYEIICVNDGSTDDSPAILNTYASRFRQIKVITQPNSGISVARNTGMDIAVGDYIWFIDADDAIMPNCLKHLQEKCTETDCDRLDFSMLPVPEIMPSWEKRREMIADSSIKKPTSDWGYIIPTILRRSFILTHQLRFLPKIAYGEDMVFNYTWDLYSYKYVKLDQVLYFYRTNPTSVMQSLKVSRTAQIKRMRSIIQILLWLRDNSTLCQGVGELRPDLALRYADMTEMLITGLMPDISHQDSRALWKEIRECHLLDGERLYRKNEAGDLVQDTAAPSRLRRIYAFNRLRFCIRHPGLWLFPKAN